MPVIERCDDFGEVRPVIPDEPELPGVGAHVGTWDWSRNELANRALGLQVTEGDEVELQARK